MEKSSEEQGLAKRKFNFSAVLDYITGSMMPIMPALMGCGMIKVMLSIFAALKWCDSTGSTYQILSFLGNTGFYFLPIMVGRSAACKLESNEVLGMVLGGLLIYPDFVSEIAAGTEFAFLKIPVYSVSYASSVIPIIICVAVMNPIEKFFARISPASLRPIIEPVATLLVTAPLSLCIVAPAGYYVGNYFVAAVVWLFQKAGFITLAFYTAFFPFVVMTGMHMALVPVGISMLTTVGYSPLGGAMIVSCMSQSAACAAVALKTKDPALRASGIAYAVSAAFGGVTEPGMYGITLKYKTPMKAAMIGNFVGGLLVGALHLYIYVVTGTAGVFAIIGFINPDNRMSVVWAAIVIAVSMLITFTATWFLYNEREQE